MSNVIDLNDHRAFVCAGCGSTRWALLRSGKVECDHCKITLPNIYWGEEKPTEEEG